MKSSPLESADAVAPSNAHNRPFTAVLRQTLHTAARVVSEAVFPTRCDCCGRFRSAVKPGSRRRLTKKAVSDRGIAIRRFRLQTILCKHCRNAVELTASPLCPICGVMFKSRLGADHVCQACLQRPPSYCRARAAAVYNPVMMRLIHAYKYGGKIRLADPLGSLLGDAFHRYWPDGDIDLAMPVPLHRRRFRQRGFNQAFLLLGSRGKAEDGFFGIPTNRKALMRARSTAVQAGLGRAQRRRNIRGAFQLRAPEDIRRRKILLIDDVLTTGATAEECSRVLMQGGAARVDVLTVARSMPPGESATGLSGYG